MVKCGGCGQDVKEKCRDHPEEDIRPDDNTPYFLCGGGHNLMPHYAVCWKSEGASSHYLTRIMYDQG